ncbi:hypothetical protein S40285_07568 [Stachybotrys chlorohalonatus IBT 40285]|uniref:Uncharacterized protein n=1 Tax=Stachybotrys chlorohalonatus (strain IBT 40285) TaxID=1283841 RepID=A0A084Q8B2_STAC4|nr:hypothetical protein S40285_07568 [Stachybotrys chlorohalonata IBT 40285]
MAQTYSRDQLEEYFSFIGLPAKYRLENNPTLDLDFLTALHVGQITTVPYDDLQLHYSADRHVSLDIPHLFRKIVQNGRGRGGYCLEASIFFLAVLRSLGFKVYPVGAKARPRVNGVPHDEFKGWVHMVNIVTLADGTRWMIDVGFGGDGPTKPVPLDDGKTIHNMGTQEARVVRDFIPGQTDFAPERRWWLYQCRNGPDKEWVSSHCFHDQVEWQMDDFLVTNHYVNYYPTCLVVSNVLVVKFLARQKEGEEGVKEVYGKRMMYNEIVKENITGKTQVVKVCETEEERVEALRKWFDIELTEEERVAIRGHATEIGPKN